MSPKTPAPLNLLPPAKPVPSLGPKRIKDLPPIWASSGVAEKPEGCKECPFRTSGSGFVPDWYADQEERPRVGFLLDFPAGDDVVQRRPWAGAAGHSWEKRYLAPFGLSLRNVMISHVLRCQPKERRFGKAVYPTAALRRGAELTCRRHDTVCWSGPETRTGGIHSFDPDVFVVSFHPSDAILVPALSHLILADIRKAVKFADQGRRPLVVMGDEGKELVAPWLRGAVKTWRGHWWQGNWPFKEGTSLVEPELGFLEA